MTWGAGPALGPLTFLGYVIWMVGVFHLWRNREEFFVWVQDEFSFFRRNFSRYTPAGRFYSLREESRFKAIPVSFVRSIARFPRSGFNGGAILLFLGFLLFILDFFV